jgi:hypothetical protein
VSSGRFDRTDVLTRRPPRVISYLDATYVSSALSSAHPAQSPRSATMACHLITTTATTDPHALPRSLDPSAPRPLASSPAHHLATSPPRTHELGLAVGSGCVGEGTRAPTFRSKANSAVVGDRIRKNRIRRLPREFQCFVSLFDIVGTREAGSNRHIGCEL